MTDGIEFRVVDTFPEPAGSVLVAEAFVDYQPSVLLAGTRAAEAAAAGADEPAPDPSVLRIGAFRGPELVGWTYGHSQPRQHLYMVNSGVTRSERGRGIYPRLLRMVIAHARSRGYVTITSRHEALGERRRELYRARAGAIRPQPPEQAYTPSSRAISIRCTSLVPSPISRIFASR